MGSFPQAARELPELATLYEVLETFGDRAEPHVLATVAHAGVEFPIVAAVVGAARADAPTLALFGGVHGLERIGTRVVLAAMHTLAQFLTWDHVLDATLSEVRLLFVPLINPVGMWLRRRSNARGVDLMRNAAPYPEAAATPLVGGQRLSPHLPWFQGERGAMEVEARALCEATREWVLPARRAVALDVHSGFGTVDRLWFPYAHTRRPFPSVAEAYAMSCLLDDTLPNHVYVMEPVSRNYTVQGDLWDRIYDEYTGGRAFLPLTLELGSWLWVKKNPRQLFDVLGGFNPIRPHRLRRTLRRHLPLIEFLLRAVASERAWSGFDAHERQRLESAAFAKWFA
ncbi:DUF2817 domain-containing protein [Pseudenhygromyxa sp. WMMC2535]|uniref:DUF2817 domain-containing protein n=1 Tax=Pseudenhygromyxa sp. WMMC2535 TaxID=2712867 RepID=UPI0015536E17|nr:DUF2817 domain-containing protein [Pseudenhygromyxa sp. WMMC2535]NVB37336.1 DUF2817 domain-containing protein [Pseudenhygromyxa sp. WMMC2535]